MLESDLTDKALTRREFDEMLFETNPDIVMVDAFGFMKIRDFYESLSTLEFSEDGDSMRIFNMGIGKSVPVYPHGDMKKEIKFVKAREIVGRIFNYGWL